MDDMKDDVVPMFKGGQGRSAASVRADGESLVNLGLIALLLLCVGGLVALSV